MATLAIEHTNEALAFITLYKTMTAEVRQEVKEMIVNESENEEASLFTSLSLQSWEADDDLEENKVWEKLYNERKCV
jgi:hypothetical protein